MVLLIRRASVGGIKSGERRELSIREANLGGSFGGSMRIVNYMSTE